MNKLRIKDLVFTFFILILSLSLVYAQDASSGLLGGESENYDVIAGAIGTEQGKGNSTSFNVTIHGNQQPYGKGNSSGINVSLGYLYVLDKVLSIVPQIILNSPLNDSFFGELFFRADNITLNFTVIDPDDDLVNVYLWGSNATEELEKGENALLAIYKDQTATAAGINFTFNWTAPLITPETAREGTDGPVLIMHFDNRSEFGETTEGLSNNTKDFSGEGNDGIFLGGATINKTSFRIGSGAAEFDGVDDRIAVSDAPFDFTDNFTLSAWVYRDTVTGSDWTGIIDKLNRWSTGYSLAAHTTSGIGFVGYTSSSGWFDCEISSDSNFGLQEWHHFAANVASGIITCYLDGTQIATIDRSGETITVNDVALGLGSQATDYLDAKIDEVAIWNRSLSAREVKNLYQLQSNKYFWKVNVTETEVGYVDQSETRDFTINRENPGLNASINNTFPQINKTINLTINASDNYDLETCQFIHNQTGEFVYVNETIGGTSEQCSQNFTILVGRGNIINFTAKVFDSANNSNQSEFLIEVNNTPPPQVQLIAPNSSNVTINRTPNFSWENLSDPDGDPVTFNLEFVCVQCTSDNRQINETHTNHTLQNTLKFLDDDGYSYNWSVRASDGFVYGDRSEIRNISIVSFVSITMPDDSIDFGSLILGQEASTHEDSPPPFTVENDGNVNVNITIWANQSLWQSESIPNASFQYKVDNTSEVPSFLYEDPNSTINWTNVTPTPRTSIINLSFEDQNDTAEIDIKVRVPLDEPAGTRSSRIILEAHYQ